MRNFFKKRRSTFSEGTLAEGLAGNDAPPIMREVAKAPFAPRLVTPGEEDEVASPPWLHEPAETRSPPPFGRAGTVDSGDDPVEAADRLHFSMPVGRRRGIASDGLSPEANRLLREAFTPTRPKLELNSLFVGRINTLRRTIAAIEEERAHVVLYGDRGRGKTSLSNAVQQIAKQAGYFTLRMTCSGELTFEDVFRSFLRRIPGSFYRANMASPFGNVDGPETFADLLPEGGFTVAELTDILAEIQGAHVLLFLDEYDRVTNQDLRNKLAELIKNLSDSAAPLTLFIVGVAEDVDHLLGRHPSIQRALVAVHLPLMSDREIDRIIQAGAEAANLVFEPDVRTRVTSFAKGLPYYAQLLALHAARSAVGRGGRAVERKDLAYAVARCLKEADRSLVEAYNRALGPDARSVVADALYAAAQSRGDEYGNFRLADLTQVDLGESGAPLTAASLQYPLSRLSEEEIGVLSRTVEPGGFIYRFRNQMMRQYVLLRQAAERGLI